MSSFRRYSLSLHLHACASGHTVPTHLIRSECMRHSAHFILHYYFIYHVINTSTMHGLVSSKSSSSTHVLQGSTMVVSTHHTSRNLRSRGMMSTQAIFKTKSKDPVPETKQVVQKKGLFGRKDNTQSQKKTKVDKAAEYKKRQGFLGSVVGSFDFAEVRSKSDAELLYDAKYGKLKDGKMSKEQYQALRRKIGGTAKDYWKDWVEVKGEYTDKGYVSEDTDGVVGLPFLIGVVVALLGTAAYVVSQTS